jgi:CTD small phosphatase-like protein 2
VSVSGLYLKDLRIFKNWALTDLLLVDNAAYSFANQIDNGIPIISYIDDRNDIELAKLANYLPCLSSADDVRVVTR